MYFENRREKQKEKIILMILMVVIIALLCVLIIKLDAPLQIQTQGADYDATYKIISSLKQKSYSLNTLIHPMDFPLIQYLFVWFYKNFFHSLHRIEHLN